MSSAQDLLAVAAAEVGYSRWNDPLAGTKYGRWYEAEVDRCPTNYDYGASGVPYCAMFVSWCLVQAGVVADGFPSAYCPAIHNHQTLKAAQLKAGDIVLFDWNWDGEDDHVGIVEWNDGRQVGTIEGNTNNGVVARRTRAYSTICGGIRPDFNAKAPSQPTEVLQVELLKVDGWWGPATTIGTQGLFTLEQSGYITGQDEGLGRCNRGGLMPNTWWLGEGGSDVVEALQALVGSKRDRLMGPNTTRDCQRFLRSPVDGLIDGPSPAVRKWQEYINAQRKAA